MRKAPTPAPVPPAVNFDNLPDELKALAQWVVWRYVWRVDVKKPDGGAWTKIPFDPRTGREADTTVPATWATFEEARAAYERPSARWSGVGFVFSPDDPYTGVDFDDCLDPQTGEISPEVLEWVVRYDTYTEISPSGRGLKLILRGEKPGTRCRTGDTEMYDRARFFTLTGHVLPLGEGGVH